VWIGGEGAHADDGGGFAFHGAFRNPWSGQIATKVEFPELMRLLRRIGCAKREAGGDEQEKLPHFGNLSRFRPLASNQRTEVKTPGFFKTLLKPYFSKPKYWLALP
jgi:hypothetical protein